MFIGGMQALEWILLANNKATNNNNTLKVILVQIFINIYVVTYYDIYICILYFGY